MALQYLKAHDMYRSLTRNDVKVIIETLNSRIRCYGFGAVLEDFELVDCLSSVIGNKVHSHHGANGSSVGVGVGNGVGDHDDDDVDVDDADDHDQLYHGFPLPPSSRSGDMYGMVYS